MVSDTEEKTVQKRLELLNLAEELGNISEACRIMGVSRTQFYVYKKRYKESGIDGLRDHPPVHHSHPDRTPEEVESRVLAMSLEHPAWGCDRLSQVLGQDGDTLSAQTVQNILNRNAMGTRRDRRLKLEKQYQDPEEKLSEEQVKFLEKQNPAFRERDKESDRPGEVLSQYMFSIGKLVYEGRIYLHAVVDSYSNYAFANLYPSKRAATAVAVLDNDVLPFFDERGFPIEAIMTNNGREFCGTDSHPYESFLKRYKIEHWHSDPGKLHTSGFLARFRGIVIAEFFGEALRTKFYRNSTELQADLETWLDYYNTKRAHRGYPNLGKSPLEIINSYLSERIDGSAAEVSGNLAAI